VCVRAPRGPSTFIRPDDLHEEKSPALISVTRHSFKLSNLPQLRPHEARDEKTPAKVAGIKIKGKDRWLIITQNASSKWSKELLDVRYYAGFLSVHSREYYYKSVLGDDAVIRPQATVLTVTTAPPDQVSAIMSTKVVTVNAADKVMSALRTMVKHKIGSVVVVEKGKPVGILTERDVSIKVAKGQTLRGISLKKAMSKPLVTIGPSMAVWEAVELMVRKDILRLPVIEGDKLVGMVTERDILRYMVKVEYEPNMPEDLEKLLEKRVQAHTLASS